MANELEILDVLKIFEGMPGDIPASRAYVMALEDYDVATLERGVRHYLKTNDKPFFPQPGQLARACEREKYTYLEPQENERHMLHYVWANFFTDPDIFLSKEWGWFSRNKPAQTPEQDQIWADVLADEESWRVHADS